MKILITGATGFVGKALTQKLIEGGHEVNVLTRNKSHLPAEFQSSKVQAFEWSDSSKLPPREALNGIDGVINLMGENIAGKRWSDEQKALLRSSRVESTKNLVNAIKENINSPLKFFISSSAIGIYPVNQNQTLNEESKLGHNFLAQLCKEWEEAALTIKDKAQRVVIIRTGVVLESHGGALKKMLPPFKLGLGGPIGDGDHFMSWIHLDDLVNLFIKASGDQSFSGVYNGVTPHPVDNFDFTKALGHALNRPTLFPVPSTVLKIAFGEMSSVILDSQKIVSNKLSAQDFLYPTIDSALQKIFKKS